jgi:glutathione synthase/RimK-type ligase-like ATP-grasp enzyme
MILIVGQRADPQVASVMQSLSNGGREFVVVDSFGVHSDGFRLNISKNVIVDVEGNSFKLDDVKSVWWRQKQRLAAPSDSVSGLYDYIFLHREWNHILEYLTIELSSKFNINDPRVRQQADNKLLQLKYAEQVGFRVPATLISNNFDAVSEFVIDDRDKKYVFKTLTPYVPPTELMTYTTMIDGQTICEKKDSIKLVPGIFQEFIKKLFELRVTIVGHDMFSARIDSQRSDDARIDWRKDIFNHDLYSLATLDHELESRLLALHKRLGLFYGAYDLVVDNEENCFFMEVNPAGQWMWLEQALGLPISHRIADALVRGEP